MVHRVVEKWLGDALVSAVVDMMMVEIVRTQIVKAQIVKVEIEMLC